MRAGLRVAYRLLRVYWFVARPRTTGVKCVVTREEKVLLVRHTYGPRRWDFPGGGIKRGETPLEAARREFREELGLDIVEWRHLGDRYQRIDNKRNTLHLVGATAGEGELRADGIEIAEARWFGASDLPSPRSPWVHAAAARALAART